jgi:TolB-like protein/DNA-binding winged helix-turn-helix (wHTH) protein
MGEIRTIKVGDWAVSPAQNLLERDGQSVKLKPRAMDVLVYLADHAGEVVSTDELISTVWQGRVVGDGTVYQSINQLRQALGDSTAKAGYIETIAKRGYRLVADVELIPGGVDLQQPRRWIGVAAMAVVVAAVLLVVISNLHNDDVPASIAVLPFADMSPNGDHEYFGDGIADELLNELVRLDGLRVAGRTSSFSFKGSNEDLKVIGEALRVGSILEGSIRKDGDRVRVTAQLIDASDGYHLWSETYDRELADIFAIQEEIATSVSGALGVKLGVGGVNEFKGAGTRNIDAYDAYLQGRGSRGDESIRFLERATQLDPNYSAAWSMLGISTLSLHWTSNPEEAHEIRERAYAFVLRAVELDPESAQATSLWGTVLFASQDWIRGEAAHLKALSLLSDRENLSQYGNCLMRAGRSAAALEQWEKAEAVEPSLGLHFFRVYVALAQGRFADARDVMARTAHPDQIAPFRLVIALNEGDSEEIKAAIAAMPPASISTTELYSTVLSVFDSPEMVLSSLRATYADKDSRWPGKLHDIALLAAYFGDPELSLQIIGEELRNSIVRLHTVWYPMMSEVRQLPGFKKLVKDLNLVPYWRANGWADLCQPLGDDDFECI